MRAELLQELGHGLTDLHARVGWPVELVVLVARAADGTLGIMSSQARPAETPPAEGFTLPGEVAQLLVDALAAHSHGSPHAQESVYRGVSGAEEIVQATGEFAGLPRRELPVRRRVRRKVALLLALSFFWSFVTGDRGDRAIT